MTPEALRKYFNLRPDNFVIEPFCDSTRKQPRVKIKCSKKAQGARPTLKREAINRYLSMEHTITDPEDGESFTYFVNKDYHLRLGAPDWLNAYVNGPSIKKCRVEYLNKYENRREKRLYEADPVGYAQRKAPKIQIVEKIEDAFRRRFPLSQYQQIVDVQRKLHLYPSYDDLVDPFRVEAVTAWRMAEVMLLLPVKWGDIWIIKRPRRGLLALKKPEHAVIVDIWGNLRGWTNGDNLPTLAEFLGYGKTPQFRNNNPFDLRPGNVIQTQPRPAHRPMKCSYCGQPTTAEDSLVERKKRYCLACLRHNVSVWS